MTDPRVKLALMLVLGLGSLTGGIWLIVDHRRSIPPDTASDDPADLIEFMLSKYFNRLSTAQQKQYSEQAMRRYASMTADQRKLIDQRVAELRKKDPEALKQQSIRVWKQFAVSEAEQYLNQPLDKRAAWLDARVKVWKAMMPEPTPEQRERRKKEQAEREQPFSAEVQQKMVGFFQETVWPNVSSKERAMVTILFRDAGPKMAPK